MNNEELLRKYNVPGPRYTSYPTVPYWETSPTQDEWVVSVARSLTGEESPADSGMERQKCGAAVYVHVPFCSHSCLYCGCNTRFTRDYKMAHNYVGSVLKEWNLYLDLLAKKDARLARPKAVKLSELHVGGGTPTYLNPEDLKAMLGGIIDRCERDPQAEFSIEADPRVTKREHLQALRELGFTRLSLGIQDFDPQVQETVRRVQDEALVRGVTETARELGYTSVNYDLIYGLPRQTLASVTDTIEAVRRLKPDRIAFYSYAHVPWIKPAHRRWSDADIPAGDAKRALYETGRRLLAEAGYREVGMDHFTLETDALWKSSQEGKLHRNFMGYITRQVSPMIGLGVSSIGDSWNVFAQNEKVLETYDARLAKGELPLHRGHVLTAEDRVLRYHILKLMTRFETSWENPALRVPFMDSLPERLGELVNDGLVELTASGARITGAGRPFVRNVCMAFDARLVRKAPTTSLFSKAI